MRVTQSGHLPSAMADAATVWIRPVRRCNQRYLITPYRDPDDRDRGGPKLLGAARRVAGGEDIEVTRSGAAVALISPPRSHLLSAERFRELIATAPPPGPSFLDEIRAARESVDLPRTRGSPDRH
jgi:antitoxin (DNA-binding transcriptional repressor) of toxin-antitoxin stability system